MSDPIEDEMSSKAIQRREWLLDEQEAERQDAEAYDQEHAEAFDRFREDAEQFIREAAAADFHSSDVDPGRVDPWDDR